MVIPLVLFFSLMAVVATCWYYRRRNAKAVNIWDAPDEDMGKQRDKTRMGEGEIDEISSSGGGSQNNMMNDMGVEKKRQKQSLLDAQQYTVQGQ
jgi:hypothetical protein